MVRFLENSPPVTSHSHKVVPAHLLSWIIKTTAKLEIVTNKGLMDGESCQPLERCRMICMDAGTG